MATIKQHAPDDGERDHGPTTEELVMLVIEETAEVGLQWCLGPDFASRPYSFDPDGEYREALGFISSTLQALATKLEEVLSANMALGQMVGGLFGTGTTATDETLLGLHAAGQRMRAAVMG